MLNGIKLTRILALVFGFFFLLQSGIAFGSWGPSRNPLISQPQNISEVVIYSDNLSADWNNQSWGGTVLDFAHTANPSPQVGLNALEVEYQSAWTAMFLNANSPYTIANYDRLQFWIHGGSSGGQEIRLYLRDSSGNYSSTYMLEGTTAPTANTWELIDIPLSFFSNISDIKSITFQNDLATAQSPFYIDDLKFVDTGTPPPTPTPTPTPVSGGQPDTLDIYRETLNTSWNNQSWGGTVLDFSHTANPTPHVGTYALEVEFQSAWTAMFLNATTPYALANYDRLQFWIHGGTTGGQEIRVYLKDDAGNTSNTYMIEGINAPAANTWQPIDIPLSYFTNISDIKSITFQNDLSTAQNLFYIDELVLVETIATSVNWVDEGDQQDSRYTIRGSGGDFNGDGYDELIAGGFRYDGASSDNGKASIYYGTSSGLEIYPRFEVQGTYAYQLLGNRVAGMSAGDVNGDGYDDFMVGSPFNSSFASGIGGFVDIYYGSSLGLSIYDTTRITNTETYTTPSEFGFYLNPLGDIDGDGYDDIIIGAPKFDDPATGNNAGRAYIYFGSNTGISVTRQPIVFTSEEADSGFGFIVESVGDLNGDTFTDIAISAPYYNQNSGRLYIYYGSSTGPDTSVDWLLDGEYALKYLGGGKGVRGAGDVNGDGYDDLIVGNQHYPNPYPGDKEGHARIFFGSASGLGISNRPADWEVRGNQNDASFGWAVTGLGDINNDGYDDVAVGGDEFDHLGYTDAGRVAVYFGGPQGPGISANWISHGEQSFSNYGGVTTIAGDIDGDGENDLAIGQIFYTNEQFREGRAYLYLASQINSQSTAYPRSLEIQASAPLTTTVGEVFTYTFTVTNTGLATANNVVVTNTVPSGVNYAFGGVLANGTVSWTIPAISPGGASSVAYQVVGTAAGTVTNDQFNAYISQGVSATDNDPVTPISTNIISATVGSPEVIAEYSFAYFSSRGEFVLYGGNNTWPYSNSTWKYFGNLWHETSTSLSPVSVYGHSMTYDPLADEIVLFGGSDQFDNPLSQTWSFSGTDWTQLSPTSSPSARVYHQLTTDEGRNQLILFGGQNGSTYFGDLWAYQSGSWTELITTNTGPSPRALHGMAYGQDKLFIYGGRDSSGTTLNDLWVLDLPTLTWQNVTISGTWPQPLMAHAMAYDPDAEQVVITGGTTDDFESLTSAVWFYDQSAGWTSGPEFIPIAHHQMVFDPLLDAFVTYFNGQTWIFQ